MGNIIAEPALAQTLSHRAYTQGIILPELGRADRPEEFCHGERPAHAGSTVKGHDIFFGVRHPQDNKTRQLLQSIGLKAQAGTVAEAAVFGEVIVLATPWQGIEAAIRAAGDLHGKTLIDCTNPLKTDISGLEVGFTTSGAERVAQWAVGAKVFKAFNTTGSNNMADPVINGIRTVMFVCGDDETTKPVVMQLAADLGFDAVDAGKLA